jgi:glycosyl transferase family 2
MPERKLTVLVPSRNRADLGRRTVESLLAQGVEGVSVVVSDNSTDPHASEELAAACRERAGVHYLRAPGDLAMTDHWNWVFGELRSGFAAPLVTMVTDRMVMRPGMLAKLLGLAESHPGRVVTYNHDAVDDTVAPVRPHLQERSERAFELSSAHVLWRGSKMYFHPCIPRMMNCVVPMPVLDEIESRFGSLFASISPDHCFAFRCLDVVDEIVYWDACPLIHYALTRSNGAGYARGLQSAEVKDFQSHLGGVPMNASAPVPEFHTIGNAVVNEYCFVREESQSNRFRRLDEARYLGAMAREIGDLEDPALRARMRDLLDERGWQRWRWRYLLARAYDALELAVRHPSPFVRAGWRDVVAHLPGAIGRTLGEPRREEGFATSEEALDHLMAWDAPTQALHLHLLPLITPSTSARELAGP